MDMGNLKVAEYFYSVQGEGPSSGKPSVFLRLAACNLVCGGKDTIKDGLLHDGATWRCDTIDVWNAKPQVYSFAEMTHQLDSAGWIEKISSGAHLVITGGEPLLQQRQLTEYLELLIGKAWGSQYPYIEVETNGTILPTLAMDEFVTQWNVSPKLANSGMPESLRVIPNTLHFFAKNERAVFKFVVKSMEDWLEIVRTYAVPFNIPSEKIWLMPAAENKEEYAETSPLVADICKEFNLSFSGRHHINIWGKKTGV